MQSYEGLSEKNHMHSQYIQNNKGWIWFTYLVRIGLGKQPTEGFLYFPDDKLSIQGSKPSGKYRSKIIWQC